MNTFTRDLLGKKIQSLMDAKCPSELACGDDDAWYNGRRNEISRLLLLVDVVEGKIDDYSASDLRAFSKEIVEIVDEELEAIRYNASASLEGMVMDAENNEHFHEFKDAQADPVGQ